MEVDLLHPDPEVEQRKHKTKRLVQCPNSFFMDVKCPGCLNLTTVFSHAQTVICCQGGLNQILIDVCRCGAQLCHPTGGKCELELGTGWRRKNE